MNTDRPTDYQRRARLIVRRYRAALERKKIAAGQADLRRIRAQMEALRAKRMRQLKLPLESETAA